MGGWLSIDIDPDTFGQNRPAARLSVLAFVAGRVLGGSYRNWPNVVKTAFVFYPQKAVDLLTICMSCGMSLEEAFDRVASEIARRAPEVAKEISHDTLRNAGGESNGGAQAS